MYCIRHVSDSAKRNSFNHRLSVTGVRLTKGSLFSCDVIEEIREST